MIRRAKDLYERISRNEFFVDGTAFMWTNFPRLAIETITGVEKDASVNTMIGATLAKPIFGRAYEFGRKRGMDYLVEKGWIDPKNQDDGKKTFDRAYGPLVALGEALANGLAYHFIYGEKSFTKSLMAGALSAGFTAFGNLNGRVVDTVLELSNMENEGRGFVPSNTPLEMKKRLRDTYNAVVIGFPIAYVSAVKLFELFGN